MNTVEEVIAALDGEQPVEEEVEEEKNYLSKISSATAFQKAEESGKKVILPKEDELFIDIDGAQALDRFNYQLPRIAKYIDIQHEIRPSPSGEDGHYHVYCKVGRAVDKVERILIQLLLGSDQVREFLSWARWCEGDPNPTLFFEKEEATCQ